MNVHFKIQIPLKDNTNPLNIDADLLLNPMYVTEGEVLSTYLDEYTNEQEQQVREMVFKNSLEADLIVGKRMNNMDRTEVFALKRQLTLCLSIISFGNKFNQNYLTSLSRTKVLAEFTVTTSSNNNPKFVINTIEAAQQCVSDIKDALSLMSGSLIDTFVKGAGNGLNNNRVNRLWHHYDLAIKSNLTHAADKQPFNGRYYKNGGYTL